MTLLTELSVLYQRSKDLDGKNCMVDEIEKIDEEYSNIMDQVTKYLYNRKDESSNITGTLQSKVRCQLDGIRARGKIREIEIEFKQKQKELELHWTALEEKYRMEMQVLNHKFSSKGKKFELSRKEVLDIPEANGFCDLDSVQSEQIHDHTECRKETGRLMLIKNRQLKRLVNNCGEEGNQFQCLMEIKEIMRIRSQH